MTQQTNKAQNTIELLRQLKPQREGQLTENDFMTLAQRQGTLLAELAAEQRLSLVEYLSMHSGTDIHFTTDIGERGGHFYDDFTGDQTIMVPRTAHQTEQRAALLRQLKVVTDLGEETQLYGTDPDTKDGNNQRAIRHFIATALACSVAVTRPVNDDRRRA